MTEDWMTFTGPEEQETADSLTAFEKLVEFADAQLGDVGYAIAEGGAELRIKTRGYLVAVRGQSSTTAHGKHGMHPARLASLRELEEPVLCVFVEAGAHVGYTVWLDHGREPEVHRISLDPAAPRQGWACKDMTKVVFDIDALGRHPGAVAFRFPEEPPAPDTADTKGSLF